MELIAAVKHARNVPAKGCKDAPGLLPVAE
jgi:hypothetical protein